MPKRGNFARIHFDAWANAEGQVVLPVRTGGELTIAHKAGDRFCLVTVDAGKVTDVTDDGMTILYDSGEVKNYPLGRSFNTDSGKTIPANFVTDRKKGYKFAAGEVLAWDSMFFERDFMETTQVAMLIGVPAVTALRETRFTYEDSSIQSTSFAGKMRSKTTHIRDLVANYDEGIRLLVKEGDHLDVDTVVAHILPAGVEFTDDSSSLDYHSLSSPTSKFVGDVERIEVLYCGDYSEASDGVKKIIRAGDKSRKERAKYTGEFEKGLLNEPTHIGKNFVARNSMVVRIYITHDLDFANGDKYGVGHQLKSVSSGVFDQVYTTIKGLPIDVEFSYNGIMARIVESPVAMGIINMYVREVGLHACNVYEGREPTDYGN